MKKPILFFALLGLLSFTVSGQRPVIEYTFSALNGEDYIVLDSVLVKNNTQECDTVLYYPDTVLVLQYVTGLSSNKILPVELKSYPNPFNYQTTIEFCLPSKEEVSFNVTNSSGKALFVMKRTLDKGKHTFTFIPGNDNVYIFTISGNTCLGSIKLLGNQKFKNNQVRLIHNASKHWGTTLKNRPSRNGFLYELGDELVFVGYHNGLESGMLDITGVSQEMMFQFASNIPCPGIPTVNYGGQIYNTVQIGSQCWLKENLNIGTMITSDVTPSNNGTIEKYCFADISTHCDLYGGLYRWEEMMQYTTNTGAQGICPPGWHIPGDAEFKILEGFADSQYGIGNPEWDDENWNGFDVSLHLKSNDGWNSNGNGLDTYGFSSIPAGWYYSGTFNHLGEKARFWTSDWKFFGSDYVWMRQMDYNVSIIYRYNYNKNMGHSVRCLKN